MPSMSRSLNGGIQNTTEWILIQELCQIIKRLNPQVKGNTDGRKRKPKLRNAINALELQIRQTFTTLRFDLLIYLQDEVKDEAPQEDFYQDTSAEDTDDTSSEWSTEPHPEDHPGNILRRGSDSIQPSVGAAQSRLERLCEVLEARVNPALSTPRQRDNISTKYPRLIQLIETVNQPSYLNTTVDLLPTAGSERSPFLFNISKDEATAEAFAAFTDPSQKRPPKETRSQMTADAKEMQEFFRSFNSFVDGLQMSAGSLATTKRLGSKESLTLFSLLQKIQHQTEAACRAVLSQIKLCKDLKHEVLLELPGWDKVPSWDSTRAAASIAVPLFFTMCLLDKRQSPQGARESIEYGLQDRWQHARMFFLQSENEGSFRKKGLCEALSYSHNRGMDLEFYVSTDSKSAVLPLIPIHIPSRRPPQSKPIYGKSFPSHNLYTLIDKGRLNTTKTFKLRINSPTGEELIDIRQRKTLGINLVLGLMLSLDSDYVFETWDPEQVQLLESADKCTPFVPVPGSTSCSSHSKSHSFFNLSSLGSDYLDEAEPPVQFVLLAKALLQIAEGDPLKHFEVDKDSSTVPWNKWKMFRSAIEDHLKDTTCGAVVNREVVPFCQAALGCLDFLTECQSRLLENPSIKELEVAWQVVYDIILVKIDESLTLERVDTSSSPVLANDRTPNPRSFSRHEFAEKSVPIGGTNQSGSSTTVAERALTGQLFLPSVELSQPNIQLFDTKQAVGPSNAREFWTCLETFHKSYAHLVTDRDTQSGDETPRRVRIAVIDTGVDFGHGGLADAIEKGRIKKEWCHSWVGADAKDEDDGLHGTNCAYLLHKSAPEADIFIEKVFNQNAVKDYEAKNIARAIEHAITKWEVDIISMSFGLARSSSRNQGDEAGEHSGFEKYPGILDDIETAIRKASPRLMFAAASNSGKNEPRAFPASDEQYVFCVHASTGNGQDGGINPEVWSGFNFMTLGMGLDLMKKENFVKNGKTLVRYKSAVMSGTSFATPIAAGIAATVLDLAARVKNIDGRAKKKLKTPEGMQKMLRLMSTPKEDTRDRMCYMAPWHHWENGWERNEAMSRWVWDEINVKVGRY